MKQKASGKQDLMDKVQEIVPPLLKQKVAEHTNVEKFQSQSIYCYCNNTKQKLL